MKRTFSMLLVTLLLVSMFTATFSIRAAETGISPLTVPEEPATMQETINVASQEPPPTEWNKTYGGTDGENALALVQTVDGGYALAGYTASFGAGGADSWLVKTDATGNALWNKTYGGIDEDYPEALVQTVDGGYALAGWTVSFGAGYYDSWLVKTDSSGNAQWNKTYGGTNYDDAWALVQTVDGGYALAGRTNSFGAGSSDFWLVKTAPDSWTGGTIYIRADGSIDPPTAPIQRNGDVYTLTGNIISDADGIVIERNNVMLDGAGYTVAGSGSGNGTTLAHRTNVTVRNMGIRNFIQGICLDFSNSNVLFSNNVMANNWLGIWLDCSSSNTLFGNSVTANNGCGIGLHSSSSNTLVGNNVTANNGHGISLGSSSSNTLSGNNITANNHTGIQLDNSSGNTLSGNNVTNNLWGLTLGSSSNNSIVGNNITANTYYGIMLQFSLNISISGNNITNNSYGIRLEYSSSNSIFHNNFINNAQQAYSSDSVNVWDDGYPSGGNYWSDYTGVDANGDGIGDTPHILDAQNVDNYPLMQPFTNMQIPGDINNDGTVDIFDIVIVALEFGHPPPPIVDPRADVNKDGLVDIFDITTVALAFNSKPGDSNWNPVADINSDNIVDIFDIVVVALRFGETG